MSVLDELSDGARKVFLANVGAVAFGAEKSKDLIDDLIKKGEITVEQGKKLDGELKRRVVDSSTTINDTVLEQHMKGMTDEERAAFVAKVNAFAAASAKPADAPAEDAEEAKPADGKDAAKAE